MALAERNQVVQALAAAVLTRRSAIAFALGASMGVRKLAMPRQEQRWSKSLLQTRSRSWIR
jgi:hypothetical protein